MRKTILGLTILLLGSTAFCAELLVPSQYSTIQAAIDAAATSDTVIVSPGTYEGTGNINLTINGKTVTIRSIDPNDQSVVESTMINCNGSGNGFSLIGTNSSIEGLTIINSYTSSSGAIFIYLSSSPTIRNCIIKNNNSGTLGSGGIYSLGSPTVIGCKIIDNHTTGSGGGIYSSSDGALSLINCVISDNTAGMRGGGICGLSSSVMTGCIINNNSATGNGGGIYSAVIGTLRITNSSISGNVTSVDGGGIYASLGAVDMRSSVINGNFSQSNGGGVYGSALSAKGCTFAGNDANGAGGGVYIGSSSSATNCIFWGNSDSGGTGSATAQIRPPSTSWAGLLYCCIQDTDPNDANIPFGGTDRGNIDDDPLFVNPDTNDYHLTKDSPCIEAGNSLAITDPNATDIDGQPRKMGLAEDMGADEYELITVVTRPVEGEVWAAGSRHLIKWVSPINSVNILLSTDNGLSWQTIASDITDANSFLWTLPGQVLSNQCLISVVPADEDANAVSVKSGVFTIWPYPSLPPVPPSLIGKLPGPDLSHNAGPQLGCVKWVFETAGPVSSQVAVTRPYWDGYGLYIGCEDGNIYALDDFGELIWSYDINTPIVGSPAVGYYWMVYVAGQNGWLYAFDDYGQVRWTHKTGAPVYSTPVVGYDGKIFACSQDGLIYALAPDGSELWTFQTNGPENLDAPIFATPAIDKAGAVYIAGLYDPNLYALDANTGNVKWVCSFTFGRDLRDMNIGLPFAAPAIGPDGTIYQTLVNDPNLYAIDPCDGHILWSTNLRQDSGSIASGWSSPVVGPDGTIYVCLDDPNLLAVSPGGQIEWVTRLGAVGGFTLSVDKNGLIYAASDDNYVCVINSAGEELSRFKGNGWVTFPAIADDGTLIVSDANNRVWAISDTPCQPEQSALHWIADLQLNWSVDFADFALMANDWLQCSDPANAACDTSGPLYRTGDLNRSYYVDYEDIAAFSNLWLMETSL